jgi:hypothetical protein
MTVAKHLNERRPAESGCVSNLCHCDTFSADQNRTSLRRGLFSDMRLE